MKSRTKEVLEWIYCILIAVILALLVRYFLGTPTIVQQPSMFPTLKENQRLILNRLPKTLKQIPSRGEIITFEAPSKYLSSFDTTTNNPIAEYKHEVKGIFGKFTYYVLEIGKTSYIKRVIGLPGERITIKDGRVYINNKLLDEPYLQEDVYTSTEEMPFSDIVVPDGTIFVLGDNRTQSVDSRRLGCIPLEKVESKVLVRIWPLNLFGKVK